MTTPQPQARDKQRAAADLTRAVSMVCYRCAVHHRTAAPGGRPHHLDGLTGAQIEGAVRVLSRMLSMQLGGPTVAVTPTVADAWALAEKVAARSGYDIRMWAGALGVGADRTHFWASATAYKPEDDPDWG